jgi:hypothetical protein
MSSSEAASLGGAARGGKAARSGGMVERDGAFWREAVLRLTRTRGPMKTVCPSEVARQMVPGDWRTQMDAVRAAARELAAEGLIEFLQRGQPVDPRTVRGAIRLCCRQQNSPSESREITSREPV